MQAIEVARHIESIIAAITLEGKRSTELIEAKAESSRVYDKALAVRAAAMKIEGMAATLIDRQAKGDASQLLSEMIVATESLKAHWKRLDYLQAQLNGFQSINRHLDST